MVQKNPQNLKIFSSSFLLQIEKGILFLLAEKGLITLAEREEALGKCGDFQHDKVQ